MMKLKRPLSLILSIALLIGFTSFLPQDIFAQSVFGENTAQAAAAVTIDKTYMKAGQKMVVSNPNGYSLRFFVGDKNVANSSLKLSAQYYEKWITVKAYSGETLVGEDKAYFSRLPVIYINTDDGEAVTSKEDYKTAQMHIQSNDTLESAVYSGSISIKGRGNTTWNLPKKPYKIKLDKKTDLFGMGKNKHWVLLANYIDESLMRNQTAADLSKQLGVDAMDSVWTDVVFNGEYVGNYQLCEHIRIDDTRIDIFDWEDEAEDVASAIVKGNKELKEKKSALEDALKEDLSWVTSGTFNFENVTYKISDYCDYNDDISGGYLFEMSAEYDEISKFTTPAGLKVMLRTPEYLNTSKDMMFYASRYWTCLEAAYRAEDGYVKMAEGNKHYTELADLDSMVGYWLVMEIMGNNDAVWKSRFAYKDVGELLKFGPSWDFDYYSGSMLSNPDYDTTWVLSKKGVADNFFKDFLDDPLFICRATEMYWQIRPYLESLIKKGGILDTQTAYLTESGLADQKTWNRADTYNEKARGFEADAAALKTYLKNRIAWLDKQFDTDRVLGISVYNPHSTYPYTKADDKLVISLKNADRDKQSQHAAATGIIGINADVGTKVTVSDSATKSLNIYVNGLFYKTVKVSSSKAEFSVPSSMLTYDEGRKNVISLIGKNAKGLTTCTNYATVIKKTYNCGGNHSWKDISYSWSDDCKTCTASAVCAKCGEKLTETVNAVYAVTKAATCSAAGTGKYTASFSNAAFAQQKKTVPIAMLEHNWGEWETTVPATATTDGKRTRTCSVCAQTQTEVIPATAQTTHRFSGSNRYDTAANIAADSAAFTDSRYVILASGSSYADALAGVPLAKALGAPILLTDKDILPEQTLAQIKSLKNVRNVIILGGTGVISENICKTIESNGYVTERIAGASRFETATKIAEKLAQVTGSAPKHLFFVYYNNYADALCASSAAAAKGSPILFVRTTGELDSATQAYLKSVKGSVVSAYAIGGEAVISDSVRKYKIANHLGIEAQRVAGANRYLTSIEVNKAFANSLTGTSLGVATGRSFPDALAGSVLTALDNSPLILADDPVSQAQKDYVKSITVKKLYVFGGTSAVPKVVVDDINKARA